jgi:hypothetical protein
MESIHVLRYHQSPSSIPIAIFFFLSIIMCQISVRSMDGGIGEDRCACYHGSHMNSMRTRITYLKAGANDNLIDGDNC